MTSLYCKYCASDLTKDGSYSCGTRGGVRETTCIERENSMLRAEKENCFQQSYDLEWQRQIYADALHYMREGDTAQADVEIAKLNTPFKDRDDKLTAEFIASREARRARYES